MITPIPAHPPTLPQSCGPQQGLTLVETLAAMMVFLVALGGIVPLFMTYTASSIRNEVSTGAIAVSQEIMDELRQADASTLPESGTTTELPSTESIATVTHLGIEYNPTISYCEDHIYCDENSRHIKIRVRQNGEPVYEIENVYTKLE